MVTLNTQARNAVESIQETRLHLERRKEKNSKKHSFHAVDLEWSVALGSAPSGPWRDFSWPSLISWLTEAKLEGPTESWPSYAIVIPWEYCDFFYVDRFVTMSKVFDLDFLGWSNWRKGRKSLNRKNIYKRSVANLPTHISLRNSSQLNQIL